MHLYHIISYHIIYHTWRRKLHPYECHQLKLIQAEHVSIQCNIAPCFFGALYVDLPGVGTFLFPGDSAPRSWTGQVKTGGLHETAVNMLQTHAIEIRQFAVDHDWSSHKRVMIYDGANVSIYHTMLYAFDILLMPWKNIQTCLIQISDPDELHWERPTHPANHASSFIKIMDFSTFIFSWPFLAQLERVDTIFRMIKK